MTRLEEMRTSLRRLGARRRRARFVDAALLFTTVVVVAAVNYYLLDRLWTLDVASRLFLDVVASCGAIWLYVRYVHPATRWREDEIEAAIRFERGHGIDSDLVAALQFDAVGADDDDGGLFGSAGVRERVVAETTAAGRDWNFAEEPSDAAPTNYRLLTTAVIVLGLIAALADPERSAVFLRRVLLGSEHYPSNTRIEKLTVAGRSIEFSSSQTDQPAMPTVVVPQGRPATFELTLGGTLPEFATVELSAVGGDGAKLELAPVAGRRDLFQGVLPPLVESVIGRAVAGDAYTEPFQLTATPLPLATVTLDVRLPAYASGMALDPPPPGRLHISVLEGSTVSVRAASSNKPLRKVTLILDEQIFSLLPIDATQRVFQLDPAQSPLAAVKQPLEFEVQVEDVDGFNLLEPLRGGIVLRPDEPPTVTAELVTSFVLPTGKPTLTYRAADDLGLQSLVVRRQVLRTDGTTTADELPIPLPPEASRTVAAGKFAIDLNPLQLHKGDKVTIRLEARDRSLDEARPAAESEPFVVEVTDEQGLYAAMAETDQRSALKMDEIIQKQLLMTGRSATTTTSSKPLAPPNDPALTPSPPVPAPTASKPTGTGAVP